MRTYPDRIYEKAVEVPVCDFYTNRDDETEYPWAYDVIIKMRYTEEDKETGWSEGLDYVGYEAVDVPEALRADLDAYMSEHGEDIMRTFELDDILPEPDYD